MQTRAMATSQNNVWISGPNVSGLIAELNASSSSSHLSVTTTISSATETSTEFDTCPSEEGETNSTSCVVYSFVIQTVIIGILGVFGTVGNIISFLVFMRDKLKTSTSYLFQVLCLHIVFIVAVRFSYTQPTMQPLSNKAFATRAEGRFNSFVGITDMHIFVWPLMGLFGLTVLRLSGN